MNENWSECVRTNSGKLKLVEASKTFTPVTIEAENTDPIDVEMTVSDNRRFSTKMRAEFVIGRNESFDYNKMISLFKALKDYDNEAIIKSVRDPTKKAKEINEIPVKEKPFYDFFHQEIYARGTMTAVHFFFYVETNTRIHNFKQNTEFMKYLNNNRVYLKEHSWESYRIHSLAMITLKSTTIVYRQDYEKLLQHAIDYGYDQYMKEKAKEDIWLAGGETSPNDDVMTANDTGVANAGNSSNQNTNDDDDRSINTTAVDNKQKPNQAPKIDISVRIMHLNEKDNKGKRIKTPVFNLRCDKKEAQIVQDILKKMPLDIITYGKISLYDIIDSNKTLKRNLILENNEFLFNSRVLVVHGLHEDVLNMRFPLHPHYDQFKEIFPSGYNLAEYLTVFGIVDPKKDPAKENPLRRVRAYIERSVRLEDSGKWYFTTNKNDVEILKHIILGFMENWNRKMNDLDYVDINEEYSKGVRFSRRGNSNDVFLSEYEKMLIETTPAFEDEASLTSSISSGSIKKRKTTFIFEDSSKSTKSKGKSNGKSNWNSGRLNQALGIQGAENESVESKATGNHTSNTGVSTLTASEFTKMMEEQSACIEKRLDDQNEERIKERAEQDKMNNAFQTSIKKQGNSIERITTTVEERCLRLENEIRGLRSWIEQLLSSRTNKQPTHDSILDDSDIDTSIPGEEMQLEQQGGKPVKRTLMSYLTGSSPKNASTDLPSPIKENINKSVIMTSPPHSPDFDTGGGESLSQYF